MADVNRVCTVSKCTTVIDERSLVAGGLNYLNNAWVAAVRAGTTTKCQAHYHDTDNPSAYSSFFKGSRERMNREFN